MFKLLVRCLTLYLVISLFLTTHIFAGGYTQNQYDENGKLLYSRTNGQSIEFEYDQNGNMINKKLNENLLFNSSFESYTGINKVADGWASYIPPATQGSIELDQNVVNSGKRSHKLTSSSLSGDGMALLQSVMVEAGKPFEFSGRLCVSSIANGRTYLALGFYDAAGALVGWGESTSIYQTNGGFSSVAMSGIVPSGAVEVRTHVYLTATGSSAFGTVYVDSLKFAYNSEVNRLFNGEAEIYTGTNKLADGWASYIPPATRGSIELDQNVVNSGKRSHKLTSSSLSEDGMALLQSVMVEAGKPFEFSGRLCVLSIANGRTYLALGFYDATGALVGWGESTSIYQTNGGFSSVAMSGIVPSGAVEVRTHVYLTATGSDAFGTVYVDSLKLIFTN